MFVITYEHIVGIILTLLLVTAVGVYSGRKIKSAADFAVGGRKAGSGIIAGTIMGTLVGGASTVGTAQLAFKYGLSAWWFTLGGGIACFFLAVFLARPLREMELETIPQLLVKNYGDAAGLASSIFTSIGMFINIVPQVLSAIALLTAMFNINPLTAAMIAVVMIIGYVFFGGVWGSGIVGMVKLGLMYITLSISGLIAYKMVGGFSGLNHSFPSYPWFSLFGRGLNEDLTAAFSMLVGVMSTQTYIQAMFSGKNARVSRNGALISAIMIPPIGVAGILVGLYMRNNFPNINPAEALPVFVLKFLNPWLGGVVLATLLIAVMGTGAGLTLGVSTVLARDVYKKIINKNADDKNILLVSRILIVCVVATSLFFVTGNLKAIILQWSFMSMGLRGATVFFPLLGAIFLKGSIDPKYGVMAICFAPLAVLFWKILFPSFFSPLLAGLIVSFLFLTAGFIKNKKRCMQSISE
ncbi:MAG: solute:Na+ symporter, family [Thermosediminibacterales bacterium]|nr:solute:Na+ symporter, family [Thermosediminibacterales bacterium]